MQGCGLSGDWSMWRVLVAGLGASTLSATQGLAQTVTWSEIDCASSRIEPLPGLKCRSTGSVANPWGGRHLLWSVAGPTPGSYYSHLFLSEGATAADAVSVQHSLVDHLKWMNQRAENGTDFGGGGRYRETDWITFKNPQANYCVGFRRLGDSRRMGFAWVMAGIRCWGAKHQPTTAQAHQFMDEARLR